MPLIFYHTKLLGRSFKEGKEGHGCRPRHGMSIDGARPQVELLEGVGTRITIDTYKLKCTIVLIEL